MILKYRKHILIFYAIIAILSLFLMTKLRFSFSFEQFFPTGDEDLTYFLSFVEEFETDDNFLLVAIENTPSVFEQSFLSKLSSFSAKTKDLSYVVNVQSLTNMSSPSITPFGVNMVPFIDTTSIESIAQSKAQLLNDPRWKYSLMDDRGQSFAVIIKHEDQLGMAESKILMDELKSLLSTYNFKDFHILGRAYFQDELGAMQMREVIVSSVVSIILVALILLLLYRQMWLVIIALSSIALGLLIFFGLLGLFGREMNAISALYPVLMLIVGTSDVVHIVSKYIDELKKGEPKSNALKVTMNQIGLATLLTSLTTAVGFSSLLTSKIQPIRDFGLNSAGGVIIAYLVVITFTLAALSFIPSHLLQKKSFHPYWDKLMNISYRSTIKYRKHIIAFTLFLLGLFIYGISLISTNYQIENNLPIGAKITEDFFFFEKNYAGFRPFELAIELQNDYQADDYAVLAMIDKIEKKLDSYPQIKTTQSINSLYKSINMSVNQNDPSKYVLPSEEAYEKIKILAKGIPPTIQNVLVSKDKKKTRISSKIIDEGADKVKEVGLEIDHWITQSIDSTICTVRRTGTGVILDKNAEYVRESLAVGLGMALLVIAFLMAFLFKSIKMLFVALVANIIPLLFAGALLGYLGIELEATTSIIFAIVFGIAVDDSIHFLSKFKLSKDKMSTEEAIKITFTETGKAITFTTIILFFGFLVMLFSSQPPSIVIGLLISITLISAWFADLFVLPLMLRYFYK